MHICVCYGNWLTWIVFVTWTDNHGHPRTFSFKGEGGQMFNDVPKINWVPPPWINDQRLPQALQYHKKLLTLPALKRLLRDGHGWLDPGPCVVSSSRSTRTCPRQPCWNAAEWGEQTGCLIKFANWWVCWLLAITWAASEQILWGWRQGQCAVRLKCGMGPCSRGLVLNSRGAIRWHWQVTGDIQRNMRPSWGCPCWQHFDWRHSLE